MKKLIITIFIFSAVLCSSAYVCDTNYNNINFGDVVEPLSTDTPIETIEPIPEPQPKYFTTYKPTIQLGVHDYYNSIIHEEVANIESIEVIVQYDIYSLVLSFNNISEIEIPITDLECKYPVIVHLEFKTDKEYVTLSENNITMILETTLIDESLVVESDIDNIIIDFIYDTTDIKYPLTQVERYLLSSLLAHEYGYKNTEVGPKAIVSVVFNRLDYFGGTLHDIIYAKNQFTPARLIDPETGLSESRDIFGYYSHCIDTVDYISAYGVTIPRSVLYFRTDYYFNWATVTDYINIGNTYFSGLTKLIDQYDEWHHYR